MTGLELTATLQYLVKLDRPASKLLQYFLKRNKEKCSTCNSSDSDSCIALYLLFNFHRNPISQFQEIVKRAQEGK